MRLVSGIKSSIILSLFCLCSLQAVSQNAGGVRSIDSTGLDNYGLLRLDSTVKFRQAFPIITSIPPVSSSKPWEINLQYIVLDSIFQTYNEFELRDTILAATTDSDTVCDLYAGILQLTRYNSLELAQYGLETKLNSKARVVVVSGSDTTALSIGRYKSSVADLRAVLYDRFASDFYGDTTINAKFSILFSDVIARVHVLQIDSLPYIPLWDGDTVNPRYYFRATVRLDDSLKGCNTLATMETIPSHAPNTNPSTSKYFYFEYTSTTYSEKLIKEGLGGLTVDSLLVDNDRLTLSPGDELIVNLTYWSPLVDDDEDFFRLSINRQMGLGVLKLDSTGNVRDLNNQYGLGASPSYSEWKAQYEDILSSLANCN